MDAKDGDIAAIGNIGNILDFVLASFRVDSCKLLCLQAAAAVCSALTGTAVLRATLSGQDTKTNQYQSPKYTC